MTAFPDPRKWSREEFDEARLLAIADFIAGRSQEGGESYPVMLAECVAEVERLLGATDDLLSVGEGEVLLDDATLIGPLRHAAGPPISEGHLAVMADVRASPKSYKREEAERIATLLSAALDRDRFPWVGGARRPDETERRVAVMSSAALWAAQRMATKRRNESSKKQERAVRAYLDSQDFKEVPARRRIDAIDDLERGQFCAESPVAGTKADVCVRLRNGRLLLIECKYSGTALNSYKRLMHDIGDKESVWRGAFAQQQYSMGVLAGVFKLDNLVEAQDTKRIFIVWERDLAPLGEFLKAAV